MHTFESAQCIGQSVYVTSSINQIIAQFSTSMSQSIFGFYWLFGRFVHLIPSTAIYMESIVIKILENKLESFGVGHIDQRYG